LSAPPKLKCCAAIAMTVAQRSAATLGVRSREPVDEDHLQLAHPLLGGQDIQAAREVRRLVARG
jgi:hypothetical protein